MRRYVSRGGGVDPRLHGGPIAVAWVARGGARGERPAAHNCHVHPIRVGGGRIAWID
jgi:hypothetical protein